MTVSTSSNYETYLKESLDYLKQYITNMKSRPILFVGSGFSRRYIGAPSWLELLEQLINENPKITVPIEYFIQEHDGDNAEIASELVEYYRNYAWEIRGSENSFPPELYTSRSKSIFLKYKIATILNELMDKFDFDIHECREEIELIRKLNPQAIITTNYDSLLEKLFPKYEPIVGQQVIRTKKSTDIGHLLKIHGSVDDCENIVIEKQDYKNFFDRQIYLIAKLFTYFMEHPIIFIGYSLSDENIQSILYDVKQIIDAETEPMIENMWFIDWSSEEINSDSRPQREKSIPVGNGESVRVNYIKLHTYEKLYETLYQDSVDIQTLKQLEETVYNVVKSDTITNLEVDIASLRYLTDREVFLNTFTKTPEEDGEERRTFLSFATINDPNQLASKFCITATKLSEKVFDIPKHNWSHAYALIDKVESQVGIKLRDSNNDYHVRLEGGATRFSLDMVNLLKKVKNREPYTIKINGEEISYPPEG